MASDPQLLSRLARLAAEIDIDSKALIARAEETQALVGKWRTRGALDRAELMLVAANLHGYYTALETLCERVARQLDENVPAGPTWHVDLLSQMQIEVPGLRPRVIDPSVFDELQELRKFRHFFRHAYVLDFDPTIVQGHAERLMRVHPAVTKSIIGFRSHVDRVVQSLARS